MFWPGSPSIFPGPIRSLQQGNREFNSCIWMPPNGNRAGDIVLVDSTIFTTLFGGTESLETLLA